METPYKTVFKAFLRRINDPFFGEARQYLAEIDLIALLNQAILDFEFPKVDLTDKNDRAKKFNIELNFYVIEILASLMANNWMKRQLFDVELLRQTMSPLEFQRYSQANHISTLVSLLEKNMIYIDSLKKRYSRRNKGVSLFHKLGGE